MVNCGSTTCDQYDTTNAKWFKIYQEGKQPNNSALWIQAEVSKLSSDYNLIPTPPLSHSFLCYCS